jgi:hypothetical protein
MKKIPLFIVSIAILNYSIAQNKSYLSFQYGSGNSQWSIKPIEMNFTDPFGNVDTTVMLHTTGASPIFSFQATGLYEFKKLQLGIGVNLEHYFLRTLTTDGIPVLGIPTIVSSIANSTPTHFKFGFLSGYTLLNSNKIQITPFLQFGTFVDDFKNPDEGFHWFYNINLQFTYDVSNNLILYIAPAYDYSRLNTSKDITTGDQKVWINIYSFQTLFGIKYSL